MQGLPTWGLVALAAVVAALIIPVLLCIIEVIRAEDLSTAAKAGWVTALILTNFFAIVIYFAQGRTGRLGRIASYLLMLGLFGSMGLVAAALFR